MKDLSKREWEFSKGERYAIDYLEAHGYDVTIKKRYLSKDEMEVSKDGYTMPFELPLDVAVDYPRYMELFERDFQLWRDIDDLRAKQEAMMKAKEENHE